jgi:glycosyltransferase involved in cell wall biosynthesis
MEQFLSGSALGSAGFRASASRNAKTRVPNGRTSPKAAWSNFFRGRRSGPRVSERQRHNVREQRGHILMRCALIAPDIPDYSMEFAKIVAESCDVLLCMPDNVEKACYRNRNPRLELRRFRWPRQRQISNLLFVQGLAKQIRNWKPDIIHITNESNIWLNIIPFIYRTIPIVTTVHDVQFHPGDSSSRRIPLIFIRTLIQMSDAIIVHGARLHSQASRELPIEEKRICVFPHPPLISYSNRARELKMSKPDDGVFRVLFFGRFYEYKGLRYLLEAAPRVHSEIPNVRFIVAGMGDDISTMRAAIENCRFVDVHNHFILQDEAARLFSEADLLVLPYIEGSQSGVLMIAMAFALPVIVTSVGELENVVRSTGMGLVVPPRDALSLATAIIELANNKALRDHLAESGARAAAGPFSRRELSGQIVSIYSKIINEKFNSRKSF